MSKKSIVALAKEPTIQESVTKVFDLMGGVTNMIEKGSTVIIKPNVGHANPPETSVDTNPEVVRAVIREVKKASPRRIIIGEAAAVGCDTMECFEVSGIKAVADDEEVELYDIKSDPDLINIPVRGYKSNIDHVKLPRTLLEAEHIINLPILKAHASMVFSCALKNIKGVVQDQVHRLMHQENLTMAMMDVWYATRADINIVDAIRPASGYSPHTPVPVDVGCILGSFDPVAVDLIACELVGIDADLVDYFTAAKEAGFGVSDRSQIEVVGEDLDKVKTKIWVPYLEDISTRWPEYDMHLDGACSSCQALVTLNMETLKPLGFYDDRSDMTVVSGAKNTLPDGLDPKKIVLHGNCARKHLKQYPDAMFIPGCPPVEPCLYMTISNRELVDGSGDSMANYVRPRMAKDNPTWRAYVEKLAEEFYSNQ